MALVFDGHNDILLRLWLADDLQGKGFIEGRNTTHIDAPRAKKGGFCGGFFAVFVPSGEGLNTEPITHETALPKAEAMIDILASLSQNHPKIITQCTSVNEIKSAIAKDTIAAVLHLEGAEAIAPDLSNLETFYQKGLRSIGVVWSRSNDFGEGVPFDFPGSPNQGSGLTDKGIALVKACEQLGIMIDLSHLNEAGMRDVAKISGKSLIATHSNAHALCESPRNLTDWQLGCIAESGGLVGVNFASGFLREDGKKTSDTPLEEIIRHLDYLLKYLGEDGVALGSDFDGAVIPSAIGDCSGLPSLVEGMRESGYGTELIEKICRDNWLSQIAKQLSG